MKLASLKSTHTRDGQLCVVNRALSHAVTVADIAPTLQHALDHWDTCSPRLDAVYQQINATLLPHAFSFNPADMASPLPRAYQWADGSAYVNHVELVRKARGADMPAQFWTEPLMYQGGSDCFLGPHDPIRITDEAFGIDFESPLSALN